MIVADAKRCVLPFDRMFIGMGVGGERSTPAVV